MAIEKNQETEMSELKSKQEDSLQCLQEENDIRLNQQIDDHIAQIELLKQTHQAEFTELECSIMSKQNSDSSEL